MAGYLGVSTDLLPAMCIDDPYRSVQADMAAMQADPYLPDGLVVCGLVYDVATGLLEQVAAPQMLRSHGVQA